MTDGVDGSQSPTGLREQIAATIRENLGLEDFKGDQLFEGAIDADELADAVAERLGLTEERQDIPYSEPTGEMSDHVIPQPLYRTTFTPHRRWVSGWSVVGDETR